MMLERDTSITIRAHTSQRDLIDQAAAVLGKNRTDFMLDELCRTAEDILLDQRTFFLNAEDYEAFVEAMDNCPKTSEGLKRLASIEPLWER